MTWKILDSGKGSAAKNMNLDAELLQTLSEDALLHLYEWDKEAATYGHFINPTEFFNLDYVEKTGFDLAKRPTGGGIVFHVADYAFSVLVPANHNHFSINPLDNYYYINELVGKVVFEFLGQKVDLLPMDNRLERGDFCMAKPTKYDLMLKGKKIGGAAQRKTKLGYLHQGSIFLGHLPDKFLGDILKDSSIINMMRAKSAPILGDHWTIEEMQSARKEIKENFKKVFQAGD